MSALVYRDPSPGHSTLDQQMHGRSSNSASASASATAATSLPREGSTASASGGGGGVNGPPLPPAMIARYDPKGDLASGEARYGLGSRGASASPEGLMRLSSSQRAANDKANAIATDTPHSSSTPGAVGAAGGENDTRPHEARSDSNTEVRGAGEYTPGVSPEPRRSDHTVELQGGPHHQEGSSRHHHHRDPKTSPPKTAAAPQNVRSLLPPGRRVPLRGRQPQPAHGPGQQQGHGQQPGIATEHEQQSQGSHPPQTQHEQAFHRQQSYGSRTSQQRAQPQAVLTSAPKPTTRQRTAQAQFFLGRASEASKRRTESAERRAAGAGFGGAALPPPARDFTRTASNTRRPASSNCRPAAAASSVPLAAGSSCRPASQSRGPSSTPQTGAAPKPSPAPLSRQASAQRQLYYGATPMSRQNTHQSQQHQQPSQPTVTREHSIPTPNVADADGRGGHNDERDRKALGEDSAEHHPAPPQGPSAATPHHRVVSQSPYRMTSFSRTRTSPSRRSPTRLGSGRSPQRSQERAKSGTDPKYDSPGLQRHTASGGLNHDLLRAEAQIAAQRSHAATTTVPVAETAAAPNNANMPGGGSVRWADQSNANENGNGNGNGTPATAAATATAAPFLVEKQRSHYHAAVARSAMLPSVSDLDPDRVPASYEAPTTASVERMLDRDRSSKDPSPPPTGGQPGQPGRPLDLRGSGSGAPQHKGRGDGALVPPPSLPKRPQPRPMTPASSPKRKTRLAELKATGRLATVSPQGRRPKGSMVEYTEGQRGIHRGGVTEYRWKPYLQRTNTATSTTPLDHPEDHVDLSDAHHTHHAHPDSHSRSHDQSHQSARSRAYDDDDDDASNSMPYHGGGQPHRHRHSSTSRNTGAPVGFQDDPVVFSENPDEEGHTPPPALTSTSAASVDIDEFRRLELEIERREAQHKQEREMLERQLAAERQNRRQTNDQTSTAVSPEAPSKHGAEGGVNSSGGAAVFGGLNDSTTSSFARAAGLSTGSGLTPRSAAAGLVRRVSEPASHASTNGVPPAILESPGSSVARDPSSNPTPRAAAMHQSAQNDQNPLRMGHVVDHGDLDGRHRDEEDGAEEEEEERAEEFEELPIQTGTNADDDDDECYDDDDDGDDEQQRGGRRDSHDRGAPPRFEDPQAVRLHEEAASPSPAVSLSEQQNLQQQSSQLQQQTPPPEQQRRPTAPTSRPAPNTSTAAPTPTVGLESSAAIVPESPSPPRVTPRRRSTVTQPNAAAPLETSDSPAPPPVPVTTNTEDLRAAEVAEATEDKPAVEGQRSLKTSSGGEDNDESAMGQEVTVTLSSPPPPPVDGPNSQAEDDAITGDDRGAKVVESPGRRPSLPARRPSGVPLRADRSESAAEGPSRPPAPQTPSPTRGLRSKRDAPQSTADLEVRQAAEVEDTAPLETSQNSNPQGSEEVVQTDLPGHVVDDAVQERTAEEEEEVVDADQAADDEVEESEVPEAVVEDTSDDSTPQSDELSRAVEDAGLLSPRVGADLDDEDDDDCDEAAQDPEAEVKAEEHHTNGPRVGADLDDEDDNDCDEEAQSYETEVKAEEHHTNGPRVGADLDDEDDDGDDDGDDDEDNHDCDEEAQDTKTDVEAEERHHRIDEETADAVEASAHDDVRGSAVDASQRDDAEDDHQFRGSGRLEGCIVGEEEEDEEVEDKEESAEVQDDGAVVAFHNDAAQGAEDDQEDHPFTQSYNAIGQVSPQERQRQTQRSLDGSFRGGSSPSNRIHASMDIRTFDDDEPDVQDYLIGDTDDDENNDNDNDKENRTPNCEGSPGKGDESEEGEEYQPQAIEGSPAPPFQHHGSGRLEGCVVDDEEEEEDEEDNAQGDDSEHHEDDDSETKADSRVVATPTRPEAPINSIEDMTPFQHRGSGRLEGCIVDDEEEGEEVQDMVESTVVQDDGAAVLNEDGPASNDDADDRNDNREEDHQSDRDAEPDAAATPTRPEALTNGIKNIEDMTPFQHRGSGRLEGCIVNDDDADASAANTPQADAHHERSNRAGDDDDDDAYDDEGNERADAGSEDREEGQEGTAAGDEGLTPQTKKWRRRGSSMSRLDRKCQHKYQY